jgi:hypothetical protein
MVDFFRDSEARSLIRGRDLFISYSALRLISGSFVMMLIVVVALQNRTCRVFVACLREGIETVLDHCGVVAGKAIDPLYVHTFVMHGIFRMVKGCGRPIGNGILYVAVVGTVLAGSKYRLFDNWGWTPLEVILFFGFLLFAVGQVAHFRFGCRRFRQELLERHEAEQEAVRAAPATVGAKGLVLEAPRDGAVVDHGSAEELRSSLLDRIAGAKAAIAAANDGPFGSFLTSPIVPSLLTPVGSLGLMPLIGQWL